MSSWRRSWRQTGRTVVVLMSGGPVEMPWLPKVPAVVQAWYPGMRVATRSPRAFRRRKSEWETAVYDAETTSDSPAHALGAYPGKDGTEDYKEGLLVGYRWFDTKAIEPLFPFGYGLSYTTFGYRNATVRADRVSVDVTNTGSRDGAEVVELYVEPVSPRLPRPVKS